MNLSVCDPVGQKKGCFAPLPFNFILQYAIKKVQEDQELMELNGVSLVLVCHEILLGQYRTWAGSKYGYIFRGRHKSI